MSSPLPSIREAGWVALGGTLGTAARAGIGLVVPDDPTAVLVVNLAGAFCLALLYATLPGDARRWRLLAGTGFLGGFTTYSALAAATLFMTPWAAGGYWAATLLGGLAAAAAGWFAASRIVGRPS